MKRIGIKVVAGCLLALALSGKASAGLVYSGLAWVNLKNRAAGGSLGGAFNSPDKTEYVGCSTSYTTTYVMTPMSYCTAAQNDVAVSCIIQGNPTFTALIESITTDSWISFQWDANGRCTYIQVDNSSIWDTKR